MPSTPPASYKKATQVFELWHVDFLVLLKGRQAQLVAKMKQEFTMTARQACFSSPQETHSEVALLVGKVMFKIYEDNDCHNADESQPLF